MNEAIQSAITAAPKGSLVLDFGTQPGHAYALLKSLLSAGVRAQYDGATLTIPLADVKAAGVLGGVA